MNETALKARARWRAAWCALGVAGTILYFLFAALVLGLRYWILPDASNYLETIEQAVSRTIGERVTIGAIRAGWQGLRPELDLSDVRIHDRQGRVALSLPTVEAVVSWSTVPYASIRFFSLAFERPDLAIRRDEAGRIYVAGIELKDDEANDDVTDWLLSQQEIVIRDARLSWDDGKRGAPQLALAGVDFALRNSGSAHRFALRAQAPKELASKLDVRAELQGRSFTQLQDWTGRLFAELDYTDLVAWKQWVDFPLEVRSGKGGLRLWLAFAGKKLTEATADVALGEVQARVRHDLPLLELRYLEGRLGMKEARNTTRVFGRQLALKTGSGVQLAPADFSVQWSPAADGQPQKGEFTANSLELQPLAQLAEYLPFPQELRRQLTQVDPRGSVFDLRLGWAGDPEHPERYAVHGRFSELGARPWRGVPGFHGLSGNVDGSEKGGNLVLGSENVTLELPGVLPEGNAQLDSLTAQIGWLSGKDRTEVRFANLSVSNADLAGTFFGSYETRAGSSGILDLSGNFSRAEGRSAYRYIPFLPETVRAYLKSAIERGSSNDVRLRLKGDLSRFPFTDPGQGTFQVIAKVKGADLHYAEGWPRVTGIDGDLIFEGKRMQVFASRASVLGARAGNIKAVIPDLFHGKEELAVEAQVEGPTAEFLGFVETSPVSDAIDHFTDGLRAAGTGRLQLKLEIPIRNVEKSKVTGNYQFAGNQLTFHPDVPPVSQAAGRVDFTESGVTVRGATGQFLGGATTFGAATRGDGAVVLSGQGTANISSIRHVFDSRLVERASGSTPWRGTVTVKKQAFEVLVESSLQGVAINLPSPINKSAGEAMPLRIERTNSIESEMLRRLQIQRLPSRGDAIFISMGRSLSALLLRTREGDRFVVDRGTVSANERPILSERPGIAVSGSLPYLDLDAWRALLADAGGLSAPLVALNVKLGTMDFGGKRMNDLAIRAGNSEGVWTANVAAAELAGDITWRPEGQGRIIARLKNFTVPEAAPGAAQEESGSREMPALDIMAENFILHDRKLGRLELVAVNQARDWRIERFALSNPDATLTAEGIWQSWAARPSISVNVVLEVSDVGHYLDRLGYPGTVRAGTAKLRGKIGWAGNPQSIDYPTMSGNLTLSVDKGQFLKADPGIAKLLGILSLQSLLTFDFRDLFREGFAFNSISGTAQVAKGVLSTGDFKMSGASAQVSMSGDIDLARETQNLHMRVVPSLGDSASTVAGILLANPIAGLGAMIAQKILNNPLGQIFAFEYSVTGSWNQPKVERIQARRGPESANP